MPVTSLSHNSLTGVELHEAKRLKQPVRAASTGNITLTAPGATIDGVTMGPGDRFLAKDQPTASQNGIYVWASATATAARASDAAANSDFVYLFLVGVREGTVNGATLWMFSQSAAFGLGTTAATFVRASLSGNALANQVLAGPYNGAPAPASLRALGPGDLFSQSGSAPAIATGATITTVGVTEARVAPAAAVTGVILQSGSVGGQPLWVTNESAAANTVTFAADATSNVADGLKVTIPGLTAFQFVWDSGTNLWYRQNAAPIFSNQTANTFLGGPSTGAAAVPGFRAILPADLYSQSASPAAIATGGTITTAGVTMARVAPTGAVTGVILQPGTTASQPLIVANESAAASTVTFAAAGTSNVANGAAVSIPGLQSKLFAWNSSTSLWYDQTNTASVAVFGASGAGHASGAVPDPGSTAGTTKFLREDATFAVPPGTGGGTGTVTSVALTAPVEFTVGGSPITGSGTIAITKANQTANQVYAGPASGAAAAPAFRGIVVADVPTMAASGAGHAAGLAPDPGSTAGTTKFLREDASYAVPPGTGGSVFVASGTGHASGAVPDPGATAGTTRFLREDATFAVPAGGSSSGGGGSGALVPIQVIGPILATQASVTFSSIPQTGYRNLHVSWQCRSTAAVANTNIGVQFNGDTGSNYDYEFGQAAATGPGDTGAMAQTVAYIGQTSGSSASTGNAGVGRLTLPNYLGTTFRKNGLCLSEVQRDDAGTNALIPAFSGFTWRNTGAISSITMLLGSGNFDVGSYFCLYGEMDTAGPLLTPASNLLSETILTASQATISIPNIPQGYRDLRIEVLARSDQATGIVGLQVQFNGDIGANYAYSASFVSAAALGGGGVQNSGQTSAQVDYVIPGTTAQAGYFGRSSIIIPDYSRVTTSNKLLSASGAAFIATSAGNIGHAVGSGFWASTAAITSCLLSLSAGNFVAGSVVRVYGEPAAAGGASVGTGTRLRVSTNQSATSGTALVLPWDTEDNDADNQHYTSVAALTGTVAKTAGSAALVGTSTLFTTELSVGQVISVPGTATELAVVIAIADDTHLTVAGAGFANTAITQTATRVNSAVVFRQAGFYTLETTVYSAALASGNVSLQYRLNGATFIDQKDQGGINASAGYELITQRPFQQWDYVETLWTQNSGGAVNVLADERTHWSIGARPTIIVAVPYVNVQDQKASGTAAGAATAGSWFTRTLNTVANDSGSIAALATNQITLPPGTYRCHAVVPSLSVNAFQARLQNITDSATLLTGTAVYSNTAGYASAESIITGRFTLSGSKAIAVQEQVGATQSATNALGNPASFGTEVYTILELWKEG